MPNWTLDNFKKGKVTVFQAAGLPSAKIKYPKLRATLPDQVQNAKNSTSNGVTSTGQAVNASDAQAQALGKKMAARYGWTGAQWIALNNIVMTESGWNVHAANASGAYGIPQALPGTKMASAGPDWQNSAQTQIAWMLLYIRQRYGNPVNAWQFHLAHGWY